MERKDLFDIPFSKRDKETMILYSTDNDLKRMKGMMKKKPKMVIVYYLIYTWEKQRYAIIHRNAENERNDTLKKMLDYLKNNFLDNVNLDYSHREMSGKSKIEALQLTGFYIS